MTEDLAPVPPDEAAMFDEALEQAVRAFQRRHGLTIDGIVGRQTRATLNVPVEARIRQLELNLERWRWLPADLGRRYLHVNIPGYRLEVVEAGRPVLTMRAIVGTPRRPTPLFSTRLTEVVLAPYWYIPTSIARAEIWPQQRRDSTCLARNRIRRLAGGTLRQDPGPANPLGRIKFTIPNPYAIGLQDTLTRSLFAASSGAYSHGCIRIEKPVELATYVLDDDERWTEPQIEAAIRRWKEVRLRVPQPLPLYVLYWTAWVEADGKVQFRADLYGEDARLARALPDNVKGHRDPLTSSVRQR